MKKKKDLAFAFFSLFFLLSRLSSFGLSSACESFSRRTRTDSLITRYYSREAEEMMEKEDEVEKAEREVDLLRCTLSFYSSAAVRWIDPRRSVDYDEIKAKPTEERKEGRRR